MLKAFNGVERDLQVQFPTTKFSDLLEKGYLELAKRLEVKVDDASAKEFGKMFTKRFE